MKKDALEFLFLKSKWQHAERLNTKPKHYSGQSKELENFGKNLFNFLLPLKLKKCNEKFQTNMSKNISGRMFVYSPKKQ